MAPARELTDQEQSYAVKTWRHLRLAMLALVAGLGVSVAYERFETHPGCFQQQISAYYYTPARDVLVGVLLALGVCLLCVRGNTPNEDIFLNFAGMLATISAFAPTPLIRPNCSSTPYVMENLGANVGNNVFALLAIGLVALVILAPAKSRQLNQSPNLWREPACYSYVGAWLVWLTTALVLELARGFFVSWGHKIAAGLMFLFIFGVVVINAWELRKRTGTLSPRTNHYCAIAILILVFSGGFIIAGAFGWDYALLAVEISFLTLFAAFWVIQTRELWDEGLREELQ